jgi:uncharacterized protein (DUF924 family)
MPPPTPHPEVRGILQFWFGSALEQDWPETDCSKLWFGGGAELDTRIRERFGALVEQAQAGGLNDWEAAVPQRLALLLLLDQFSRHVYRGTAQAFAGDRRAQQLVLQSLALGQDRLLPTVGRVFLYMPLMHAENLALQDECVVRFQHLHDTSPTTLQASLAGHLGAARQHRDIVARFGRFPHRNAAMGRRDTGEETAFVHDGPRFGQ